MCFTDWQAADNLQTPERGGILRLGDGSATLVLAKLGLLGRSSAFFELLCATAHLSCVCVRCVQALVPSSSGRPMLREQVG